MVDDGLKSSAVDVADVKARAESTDFLGTRLQQNKKYQSKDFSDWLFSRLDVSRNERILDVGCGSGAQTLRFLKVIGPEGSVSALDISEESIKKVRADSNGDTRLTAVTADMMDLSSVIEGKFSVKNYTLGHSTYALYYAKAPKQVLRVMASALDDNGRLAVFTPVTPHGMVEIAARYSEIPESVTTSLEFGPNVLEPTFRELFDEVEVHFFRSEMRVTSEQDFMNFYSATTYYCETAVPKIRQYATAELRRHGVISYDKNGYLIIGRAPRR